jgi:nucleotide-binding universal stress UspA family protein
MPNWTRILCAVDFSRNCRATVESAAGLARRCSGALTLLHVRPDVLGPGARIMDRPDAVSRDLAEMGRSLEQWRLAAEAVAGRPVEAQLVRGEPAEEILAAADRGQFDVVVVGARTHGALVRLALGSVADRIVDHAPCSVVVVRPPREWGD